MRESARTFRRPVPKKEHGDKKQGRPYRTGAPDRNGRIRPQRSAIIGRAARLAFKKNIQAEVRTVIRRMKRGGRLRQHTIEADDSLFRVTGAPGRDERARPHAFAVTDFRPPLPAELKTAVRETRQPGFSPAARNLYPRKRGSEEPPEARPEDALSARIFRPGKSFPRPPRKNHPSAAAFFPNFRLIHRGKITAPMAK